MGVKRHLKLRASLWDRFHDKAWPEPNCGCWLWAGAAKEFGYGVIGLGRRQDGTAKAHRVAWTLYNGEIPEGQNVLHRCDNPSCVNPQHLFLGSLSDNMQDCAKKGRNFSPNNRGENAKYAIISEASAREIKSRLMPAAAYATKFGVSRRTIYAIWRGDKWAHVV